LTARRSCARDRKFNSGAGRASRGGRCAGRRSQFRRAARSLADLAVSLPRARAGQRRDVSRRVRDLSRGRCVGGAGQIRVVRSRIQWLVHIDHFRRHDGGRLVRRHLRRSLRPPLLLSAQSPDLRHRVACWSRGALDRMAYRRALCHGRWSRCRNRRRLCDAVRIRAAATARPLGLGAFGYYQFGAVRLRVRGSSDYPAIRLALDVRHHRRRRADRLVFAPRTAGIAALARVQRSHRGSRKGSGRDRSGGRAPRAAAAGRRAADAGPAAAIDQGLVRGQDALAHHRRKSHPDRHLTASSLGCRRSWSSKA
jgi:hypothetical protein